MAAPLPLAPPDSFVEQPVADGHPVVVDAETLAAYLYRHAEVARRRHNDIQSKLDDEVAAEGALRKESQTLLAEFAQYQGWINEDIEGGSTYRLSKDLVEERERRDTLESEISVLRSTLSQLSGTLQELVKQAKMETPAATQARAANEALNNLARLKALCAPPPTGAVDAENQDHQGLQ